MLSIINAVPRSAGWRVSASPRGRRSVFSTAGPIKTRSSPYCDDNSARAHLLGSRPTTGHPVEACYPHRDWKPAQDIESISDPRMSPLPARRSGRPKFPGIHSGITCSRSSLQWASSRIFPALPNILRTICPVLGQGCSDLHGLFPKWRE